MYLMSGPSQIMLTDERVVVRRENADLGNDTVVVDGKRVKRGWVEFVLNCNVQPVSGDDLNQVPEGDRYDDSLWFYVADSQNPLEANDLICRPDDAWYQVQMCEGWGSYTRARGARVDVGPMRYVTDVAPDLGLNSEQLLLG